MDHRHLWLFFSAFHEKARSFNFKVYMYLLFTMHFKQIMQRELVSVDLDVLMRVTNDNSRYLVHIYGTLLRKVC